MEVLFKGLVVGVLHVGFHDRNDGGPVYESGQVIDMSVSVVALDAVAEPKNVRRSQKCFEPVLDLFLCQSGVAVRV